jgi:hypothetical protein
VEKRSREESRPREEDGDDPTDGPHTVSVSAAPRPHGLERLHDGTRLAVKVAKLGWRSGIWPAAWMKTEKGGGEKWAVKEGSTHHTGKSPYLFLFCFPFHLIS